MEEKKNNKGLVWLIVILIVLILGLVGYVVYDKVLNNKTISNCNNKFDNLQSNDSIIKENNLSNSELQDLSIFINKYENYAFALANYSNPEELLIDNKDENSNIRLLSYSIKSSESTGIFEPTNEELNIIWSGEPQIETQVTSPSNIEYFLESKIKYDFKEEDIKNNFQYFEDIDKVVFMMSDTIFGETIHIVDGYKKDNKIYLTLDNDRELVLTYEQTNSNIVENSIITHYYFYSCLKK